MPNFLQTIFGGGTHNTHVPKIPTVPKPPQPKVKLPKSSETTLSRLRTTPALRGTFTNPNGPFEPPVNNTGH